jgi:tetratricopeptide (TPR) repeat protein
MRIRLALAALALLAIAGWISLAFGVPRYHLREARRALTQFHPEQARVHLDSCLRTWPQSSEIHLLAARAARLADDTDGAEMHLQECERLDWSPAVTLERALLRAQNGDLDQVEGYLHYQVKEEHPDTVFILEALARGYVRLYRISQAQFCLKLWLEMEPNNTRALLAQGHMWAQVHNFTDAVGDFRRVLEVEGASAEARLGLANALLELAQPEEALPLLEELRQQQPDNPEVLVRLARCQVMLNRPDEALATLDDVLASHPDLAPALHGRAQVALQQGNPEEAEKLARRAVAANPYDYEQNYLLYECLKQCGKPKEAQKQFLELERIKKSLQRMQELARQDLQSAPNDPAVRYEMGMLCLGLGREEVGLGWLLSALQKAPEFKPAHAALAKYYQSKGDDERAEQHRKKM